MKETENKHQFLDIPNLSSDLIVLFIVLPLVSYSAIFTVPWDNLKGKDLFLAQGLVALGVLVILFFGWAKIKEYQDVRKSIPYLTIDERGITHKKTEVIPWSEVLEIRIGGIPKKQIHTGKTPYVTLTLKSPIPKNKKSLTLKSFLDKKTTVLPIECEHFNNKAVYKALKACAPEHVRFFTPIGY